MDWDRFGAVLFDMDGVLTPTVEIHTRAWHALFTGYFDAHGVTPPYTEDDYFAHVDGRPRYEGVRECLASRDVRIPEGEPSDPPDAQPLELSCTNRSAIDVPPW